MPDLDRWLPDPDIRVHHARSSAAGEARLWAAAERVEIGETGLLGRLIRWRLPGTRSDMRFGELFRSPPFVVLETGERHLVSGLAGRIWTLRRDYPELADADAFRAWDARGTVRVVFGHWVADGELHSEARVAATGRQGAFGLRLVRPLVTRFQGLVGSEGIATAIRAAEGG